MKKVFILSLALLLGIGATAQVKFGVKAGLNLSSLSDIKVSTSGFSGSIFENDGMTIGFHAGGFINFSFGKHIGLQPEVLFSMQGGKQKFDDQSADVILDYINVPILLDIKPSANFSILVGPQIGLNIYKSRTTDGKTLSNNDFEEKLKEEFGTDFMYFTPYDITVVAGLQYTFINHLTIGARYNIGLINSIDMGQTMNHVKVSFKGWKNNVLQVSVGWTF
jgi:opacity protein-like surface antigen